MLGYKSPVAPGLDFLMSCNQFAPKSKNVHISQWILNNKQLSLLCWKPKLLNCECGNVGTLVLKNQGNL